MFCENCGKEIDDDADVCVNCGCFVKKNNAVNVVGSENVGDKSKVASGLLGLFLGGFGAHNFYLGRYVKAIIQLCMTICAIVLYVVGTAKVASEIIARGWNAETIPDTQLAEIMSQFSGFFTVGYLLIVAVGIWAFIEAIMCFCGAMKDGKGKKLK